MVSSNADELQRILEAALLAAVAPLTVSRLRQMFDLDPGPEAVRAALEKYAASKDGLGS